MDAHRLTLMKDFDTEDTENTKKEEQKGRKILRPFKKETRGR
jgi:hypothetical protein